MPHGRGQLSGGSETLRYRTTVAANSTTASVLNVSSERDLAPFRQFRYDGMGLASPFINEWQASHDILKTFYSYSSISTTAFIDIFVSDES